MTRDLVTFTPDMGIHDAIKALLGAEVSGGPVLDDAGEIVGMLSIKDCLAIAFEASYHQEPGGKVAEFMSSDVETIEARTDIVEVADIFLKSRYRRFPVVEGGRLVGQISRYDVLKALGNLWSPNA
ncbi:MAG: CBS domain-containing protein [Rhodospirillaceae bacterium]|nr:CBS domain-containing protein [Rhodospirillaceae bacterium]MBT6139741.1 CBS domain-containing protein [Rhodospirillaceae bacterium]